MQILIDVPNSLYANLSKIQRGSIASKRILECVRNGTPLPKGHGRLIDADVLVDGMEDDYEFCEAINATPTIIKSDKAESEEE